MGELSLADWADIADIIGACSIVSGLLFGLMQIRYFKAQQRDAIATNLTQTFYSKDLADAMALLQSVPNDITLEEMRELGQEYVAAANTVTTSFETMGLLVYKRIAPLQLVTDLAGGIITVMARKLRQWQRDVRIAQNQPSWGEWFEWLSDQVVQVKTDKQPAHVSHKHWEE